jgi:phospholipid N-methyltransferase
MASIEREIERGLLNAVSGIGGVNFFTSERGTARTMPNIVAQASIGGEELGPFTGVFKTPATLTYTERADTISRTAFDAKFYDILEQLYRSPDLASYITTATNITCYVAKVTGQSNAIEARNRTWNRAITLDITASAKK